MIGDDGVKMFVKDNSHGFDLHWAAIALEDIVDAFGCVSRAEEPRKISAKIWCRITLFPTQQKRASYGPLFCPKQTLFKSPGHPSSITLPADLQSCHAPHAVALGWVPDSGVEFYPANRLIIPPQPMPAQASSQC